MPASKQYRESVELPARPTWSLVFDVVRLLGESGLILSRVRVELHDATVDSDTLEEAEVAAPDLNQAQITIYMRSEGELTAHVAWWTNRWHRASIEGRDETTVRGIAVVLKRYVKGWTSNAQPSTRTRLVGLLRSPWAIGIGVTVIGTVVAALLLRWL